MISNLEKINAPTVKIGWIHGSREQALIVPRLVEKSQLAVDGRTTALQLLSRRVYKFVRYLNSYHFDRQIVCVSVIYLLNCNFMRRERRKSCVFQKVLKWKKNEKSKEYHVGKVWMALLPTYGLKWTQRLSWYNLRFVTLLQIYTCKNRGILL